LRALEEEKNGNNWLREVMKYLLEAILAIQFIISTQIRLAGK
jgi:hypothetical protein